MALRHGHRVRSMKFGRQLRREGALERRIKDFEHCQKLLALPNVGVIKEKDQTQSDFDETVKFRRKWYEGAMAVAGMDVIQTAKNLNRESEFEKAYGKYRVKKRPNPNKEENPNNMGDSQAAENYMAMEAMNHEGM